MVRAIVRRREMGVKMGRSLRVVRGAVQVEAVPGDMVSAGREDQVAVQECGLVAMDAAVVPVDSVPALVLAVVAFLADRAAAFLVDREWGLADQETSFRKTPRWPH
jgi:hypothetical protein